MGDALQQQSQAQIYFTSIGFIIETMILLLFGIFLVQLIKKDKIYKKKLKEQRLNQTINNESVMMNRSKVLNSSNDPDLIHTINSVNDNNMITFDIQGKTTIDRRHAYLAHQQPPNHFASSHKLNNIVQNQILEEQSQSYPIDESLNYEVDQQQQQQQQQNTFHPANSNTQDQQAETSKVGAEQNVPERFLPRSFLKKCFAFYKQCNPLTNTWRYYMRLLPRWVRAILILLAIQSNLLIIIGIFKFSNDEDEVTSIEMWGLNMLLSSLISYFILYVTTKLASASVSSFISNAKTSLEVVKKLKQLRKRVRNYQKILFMICSLLCIVALFLSASETNVITVGEQNIKDFNLKFSLTFFCSSLLLLFVYDLVYAIAYTVLYKLASGNELIKSVLVRINKIRAWKVKTPVNF